MNNKKKAPAAETAGKQPGKKKGMKKAVRIFWIVLGSGFGLFLLIVLLAMLGVFGKLPSLRELENPSILQSSEVYASDGTLMGKYYRERGNRSNVSYRNISKHVIHALIATEDERFYDHSGIDVKSTMRAVFLLGREGGGSTITQQLAKTLLDQGSKNIPARMMEKFKEYIVAIRLERNFTKEEIIALYLNAVPYGDNIYGIRNASRTFFQKEPDRLNVEEAALLIGMLKGNYIYNPRVNPQKARERRNVVLEQMEKNGYITHAETERLKQLPIYTNYKKLDENNGFAPYFREVLKDEVKTLLGDMTNPDTDEAYDIYDDGLRVYTTINPKMQLYAEEAMTQQMPMLQRALNNQRNVKTGSVWKGHDDILNNYIRNSDRWRHLKADGLTDEEIRKTFDQKVEMKVFAWNANRETDTLMTPLDSIKYHRQMLQTAFMVMDPISGEVRAWVGGISFKTYKYDHANLKTKRQVGSSIKPLLYCQAMEERGFTPETSIPNQAQYFEGNGWVPAKRECPGKANVSMAGALAHSLNCASAYLMKQVGPAQFNAFLQRVGIQTKIDVVPSIALGSCDLSLYEMMHAYSIFPGGGFSTRPTMITRIEDRNGNVIYRSELGKNRQEVVSEVTAYQMARMMQGAVDRGTAAGLRTRLGAVEMGGKTGTTNDNADAWFFGFVPQLQAGVWVGSDDRFIRIESAQGYGGSAARPIWETFFAKVYNDRSLGIDKEAVFTKPTDMNNEIGDANWMQIIEEQPADPNFDEQSADDYGDLNTYDSIGAESQIPVEEDALPPARPDNKRKDTATKKPVTPATPPEEKKEKKGFLKKIFGNKEKDPPTGTTENDY
jgi:penicillin-binding protein 1A